MSIDKTNEAFNTHINNNVRTYENFSEYKQGFFAGRESAKPDQPAKLVATFNTCPKCTDTTPTTVQPVEWTDAFDTWSYRRENGYDVNLVGYDRWADAKTGFKGGWQAAMATKRECAQLVGCADHPFLFPIMLEASGARAYIPWAMLAPHEQWAEKNHHQTLKRLAERGGLGWSEALAVLENRDWKRDPAAQATVLKLWSAWDSKRNAPERESVAVDLRLIDDAITKMTKAAANLVNGEGFSSSYPEDHRSTTPKWVINQFGLDNARRCDLGREIAQGINWVRNATAKLRESKRNESKGGLKP